MAYRHIQDIRSGEDFILFAEMQVVYSTAPADWARILGKWNSMLSSLNNNIK